MSRQVGYGSGRQVARDTDLERNVLIAEMAQQGWVMRAGDAVADAFGADLEGLPHRFRSTRLAGVSGQPQAARLCEIEHFAKPFGRAAGFVASDAEGDHAFLRGLGAEVPDGVEDPEYLDAGFGGGVADGFIDRGEILLPPKHDAGRKRDLRVLDILPLQAGQQTVRD